MSIKAEQDKKREGFPFTARQKRRLNGGRRARKTAKGKAAYRRGTQTARKGR